MKTVRDKIRTRIWKTGGYYMWRSANTQINIELDPGVRSMILNNVWFMEVQQINVKPQFNH